MRDKESLNTNEIKWWRKEEGNTMSARCGNVFFRDSGHDLFASQGLAS